jgi:hypothetical protein
MNSFLIKPVSNLVSVTSSLCYKSQLDVMKYCLLAAITICKFLNVFFQHKVSCSLSAHKVLIKTQPLHRETKKEEKTH